jgi:hypothetical protein
MIRRHVAATLAASLLALPALSLIGDPAHAAPDLTGLWFNYDQVAPIYDANISSMCLFTTKAGCLRSSFSVRYVTHTGAVVGPLPAQPTSAGGISVTLPCAHEPNSNICIPAAPVTSVTFTPDGANLRADMVTRHGVLIARQSETLCRCMPG